jgi:hypothetical protein
MLTFAKYENLWNAHFAGINGLRGQLMPPYNQYLEAENMLEDYLDIFRGVNTRNLRANGDNPWYYDHPFFDGDTPKLKEKPCIKYIMIGEARPKLKNDKPGTYFYNVNHLGSTGWLREPFKAFNNNVWNQPLNPLDKIKILLNLASKGYLLIDLYPFSIEYNWNIRLSIEYLPFWDLLTARLCQLTNDPLTHKNLFCKENAKIGFSGPAATHHRIVLDLVGGVITLPNCHNFIVLTHYNEVYDIHGLLIPPTKIKNYIKTWELIPSVNYYLNHPRFPIIPNGKKQFNAPHYKCECWDASYVNGPNSLFIRTAFDL